VHVRVALRLLTIEAARSLARNKLRAGLAILGITVAVATVIWVVAISRAGRAQAEAHLDNLGVNLIWIEAGGRSINGLRTGTHGTNTLVPGDAAAIRDEVRSVARVSESVDGRVQLVAGGRNWSSQFRGVSPDYLEIKRWQIARGAFLDDDHVLHADRVVVIGETVRRQLFDDAPALGEQLRIGTVWFTVIGTLVAKGSSATGQDQDDTVMVPWTTGQKRLLGKDYYYLDDILCSAVSTDALAAARDEIDALLRERHHISAGGDADFSIRHPEELLKARVKTSKTLQLLLLAIASISLLVGGIGVMNVMLASVVQRTVEIGIRAAIGARPSAIRLQFLAEAMMLTAVGGVLGVALADGGASIVERELGWRMVMSPAVSVLAIATSTAIGIAFGLWPAHRASRLDPIAALRTET
jgi:putative ABC transport system permease protein